MSRYLNIIVASAAIGFSSLTVAAPITMRDFSADATLETYESIPTGFVATPLQLNGVSYITYSNARDVGFLAADNGFQQFSKFQAPGSSLITMYTNALPAGFDIDFGAPVSMAGLLLGSGGLLSWEVTAIDNSFHVIESLPFSQTVTGEGIFVGFAQPEGIRRLNIQVLGANPQAFYTHFDDLRYERLAVPEPMSAALVGVALLVMGFAIQKKRN